ncbi:unnamed protein product, partial [Ectocarpus sp. 4 AP-2014]
MAELLHLLAMALCETLEQSKQGEESSPLRVLERVPADLGGERAILRQLVTALAQSETAHQFKTLTTKQTKKGDTDVPHFIDSKLYMNTIIPNTTTNTIWIVQ